MSNMSHAGFSVSDALQTPSLTLGDCLSYKAGFKGSDRVMGDALLVLAGSLLTVALSQVAVPLWWTPVPVTGQTLAVLLCGLALGWKRGFVSQMLYLTYGAMNLPVFAEAKFGLVTLLGPTGGYLLAFPIAAAVMGYLAERKWDRSVWLTLAAMTLGTAIIFTMGMTWLSLYVPASGLLAAGLLPFVAGEAIKIVLAAGLMPIIWKWLK